MDFLLETCGERLQISCAIPWVDELIEDATATDHHNRNSRAVTVSVHVESSKQPFHTSAWEPLTRGAWRLQREVVIEDACSSGFDLHLSGTPDHAEFTFRWRPPISGHAAARLLRSRFILLARSVLLQYPVLWRASLRGRAPLHASVCTAGDLQPLLAGPGGVGKSTLLTQELAAGGRAIGDNICVSDGTTAWGMVEPLRIEGGSGRSMPHGRAEQPMRGRVSALDPDLVVVLRRGLDDGAHVRTAHAASVARSLITGTYMAGELRRFWGFAATLTAGTELGPSHAPVEAIASYLASQLPSVEIVLPRHPGVRLAELLSEMEAIA
jgi:hypothetical protein